MSKGKLFVELLIVTSIDLSGKNEVDTGTDAYAQTFLAKQFLMHLGI